MARVRPSMLVLLALPFLGCGARTEIGSSSPNSLTDGGGDGDASGVPPSCVDETNTTAPPATDCTVGAGWVAWLYSPASSEELAGVEMRTGAIPVAFLDDQNGGPGSVLFQTQLGPADARGWRHATPPSSEPLTAGHRYWIAIFGSDADPVPCPAAASGMDVETWEAHVSLGGPWHKSLFAAPWATRVQHTCR